MAVRCNSVVFSRMSLNLPIHHTKIVLSKRWRVWLGLNSVMNLFCVGRIVGERQLCSCCYIVSVPVEIIRDFKVFDNKYEDCRLLSFGDVIQWCLADW